MKFHAAKKLPPIAASVIALSAAALTARAQTARYEITGLTLGGSISTAEAINNAGQVVGESYPAGYPATNHAFLWSNGSMQDLGNLGGNGYATAINNAGQVAGASTTSASGYAYPFLYSGGRMKNIGLLTGNFASGQALAINDSGQVLGYCEPPGSVVATAFLYSGGQMQNLAPILGTNNWANDINDSGQMVGEKGSNGHAFLYSDGVMQDLGTIGGAAGTSEARAINNAGQIVGGSASANGGDAFLFSNGVMQDLGNLGGGSEAFGINDLGQVVGSSTIYPTQPGLGDAFVYSNGLMQDLNSLIPAGSGWTLNVAYGINDSGEIVGQGTNPQGQYEGFLLTPTVPEPSCVALLALSAGLLLRRRRDPG